MKLYNLPPSPNAIKVWAVINHLGLEVESVPVDFATGTMKTEEYGELNPNRRMPVLVDGDYSLWESNAIMQYLAHKAGDTSLWPREPRAQADVSRWQCWQLAHWQPALGHFMYENVVKKIYKMGPPDEAKLADAAEAFHKLAKVLDAHLADRQWVATENVSVADYSLGAMLGYAEMARIPWEDYANIRSWYGRLDAMESWRKSFPPMPAAQA